MTNEEFQKLVLEKLDKLDNKVGSMDGSLGSLEIQLKETSKKLDAVIEQTADLTEFKTEVTTDLKEIKLNSTKLEFFTASNWRDIASLKLERQ